ncbi:MAG: hypothetical protein AAF903_14800 [Pseudomonadota bacterium]
MSGFFQQVEGNAAILSNDGLWRQTDLYTLNGQLFAKWGAGFIRLKADRSTSKPRVKLIMLSWDGPLHRTKFGNLVAEPGGDTVPVDEAGMNALLGHNPMLRIEGPKA